MTTNNKFMLSMATIAILSGASVALGAESELKVEQDKLQLGTQQVEIKGGTANVSPSDTDKTGPVTIKTTIGNTIGKDTMTQLNITAKEAAVNVGTANQSSGVVSIGGTAPTNGTAAADGYGVNINAKSVALAGATSNETQLNVNADSSITTTDGATLGANSAINIANGKKLEVNGGLTATDGAINVGGGALTTDSLIVNNTSKITFGENGVLTINKNLSGDTDESNKWKDNDFVKGAKGSNFDFTAGGTLVTGANGDIRIMGTDKSGNSGLNEALQLKKGTITLSNTSEASIEEIQATKGEGKINLNGGTLATTKVTADASHFDFSKGGVLAFGTHLVAMDSQKSGNTAQTSATGSTITGKTTLNSSTMVGFLDGAWVHFEELKTNGADVRFANGTLNVKNLTANASDLHFTFGYDDGSTNTLGGTIELATNGKHDISGHLTLDDKQSYKFSAAGTLNLESLSLTKTGKIEFAGKDSVLNLANGMTSDDAKTQIVLKDGGTINFNGGNSVIKGEQFATTASKDTLLNVNSGAGVSFESLDLKDDKSKLTLNGGFVNMGALTTAAADSLDLKKGTLNFVGKANDKGEIETLTSTIGADLDLSKAGAQVNFNKGSLVKFTSTDGKLTASSVNLNGGEINLKKLTAAKGEKFSGLANLNFAGANASVNGELSGTAAFSIGTDKDGNHFITKATESASIGAGSSLSLNSGAINANGTLETKGGKLVFNGGNLIVGAGETAGGKLTIDDTKNLEVLKGGVLYLQGASDGDTTKSGSATIAQGDLDLSKGLNIIIDNGASLTTTAASTISGKGQSITLGKYAALSIDGSVKTAQNGKFEAYKVGALELGKGTTLGVSTTAVGGVYKELEVGKLSTKTGESANLRFGAGSVELMGGLDKDASKALTLNNQGFTSDIKLDDDAVLNFNSGVASVKGALNAANKDKAMLKVSGATADLQGGLGANMTKIELSGGGALNLKGDFAPTNATTITTDGNSLVNVNGGVSSADKLTFALLDIKNSGNYTVLTSTKGVTGDAKAQMTTRTSLNDILAKYDLEVEDDVVTADNKKKVQDIVIADSSKDTDKISVKADGNNIVVTAKSFDSAIDSSSLQGLKAANDTKGMAADLKALEALGKTTGTEQGVVESGKDTDFKTNIIDKLTQEQKNRETAAKITSNTVAAQELGGGGVNSDILLSAYGSTAGFGARDKDTAAAIGLDMVQNGGQGIVADIKEGASSAANMSSSTSSVINTMNLSNDMAISGRIAQANNPYGNLAQGFAGYEYAAVSGDLPLYYANNGYKNGFWANAIGGLNKVEGEGGTLVGLSLGFDKQLENTLVGFYLSYAMAGLNDKIVEQGADNIQVGVYTSFNQRDIEVNVKAYGQVAVTETTAKRGEGEAEAKFTRLYGGVSANVGFIFALNNNKTFIKPYVGENYYYAHTPAYEESLQSDAALSVKSANNHALSFDVGVDLRQYFNENSFMYLTPSLERYVVNAGGDYTAGFIGSDTTFTIEGKSKTKTYGQVLVGGNIALSDKLNVNLGLGVKKILNGQIERANGDKVDEMYLSGNLGVKYRF